MPHYRAYRLDDEGKLIGSSDYEADSDKDALEIVRVLPEELGFEVWSGARMVGRIGRNDKEIPVVFASELASAG